VLQLSIADFEKLAAGGESARSHIGSVGQCYLLLAIKIIDGRQKDCIGASQEGQKEGKHGHHAIARNQLAWVLCRCLPQRQGQHQPRGEQHAV